MLDVRYMTVTIYSTPHSDLTRAETEAWRSVPVAIALDLARDIGQIDPAIRPLNPPPAGRPHLFGRARTVLCEPRRGGRPRARDCVSPGDVLMIAGLAIPNTP